MKSALLVFDINLILRDLFESTDVICGFLMKNVANSFFEKTVVISRTIDVDDQLVADFLDEEF